MPASIAIRSSTTLSTEEAQAALHRQQLVGRYGSAVAFLLIVLFAPRGRGDMILMVVVAFIVGGVALLMHLAQRRADQRTIVTSGSYARRLIPWHSLDRCSVTSPGPGRMRLRFRRRIPLFRSFDLSKEWCVLIETACSPDRFDAISQRILRWRAGVR
jgi:hypothetical protein